MKVFPGFVVLAAGGSAGYVRAANIRDGVGEVERINKSR
jgi:hypothetical protein